MCLQSRGLVSNLDIKVAVGFMCSGNIPLQLMGLSDWSYVEKAISESGRLGETPRDTERVSYHVFYTFVKGRWPLY